MPVTGATRVNLTDRAVEGMVSNIPSPMLPFLSLSRRGLERMKIGKLATC
jgi:hypothetical protein